MSNFKFKLQKLLDIRVNEEEESKLFYSKAQNQKNIVENKLHELENNYKKYSDISRAKDTISQKITMNYLSYLNTTIKDTEKELEAKEIELEKAKKDFIDMYFLLQHYTLDDILKFYAEKYPENSVFRGLMSLSYFEDAEDELMPKMFSNIQWDDMKQFILDKVATIR